MSECVACPGGEGVVVLSCRVAARVTALAAAVLARRTATHVSSWLLLQLPVIGRVGPQASPAGLKPHLVLVGKRIFGTRSAVFLIFIDFSAT